MNDERADGVFEAAYEIARSCEEDERDFALGELAETLVEAKLFDFAERVVGELEDEDEVSNAESGLASALAAEGRFDRALGLARSVARRGEGNEALLAVGKALAQAGDPRASTVLTEAWEVARGDYDHAPFKAHLLLGVALRLAEVKDPRAGDAFQEARQAVRDVATDSHDRPKLFRELAEMMAAAGDNCVDAVFDEAVAAARSYDHEASRIDFVDKLAEALARRGHLRGALDVCEFSSLDSMIEKLAEWLPHTQESSELVSAVLGETLRIAGWVRGYWLEIKLLVEARMPQDISTDAI